MNDLWINIAFVALFIVVGGVFAAAELALVSLREGQLNALERRSSRGARVAALARDPNTFLAAVQVGVTVSGFLSAAFGATALAPYLAETLRAAGMASATAEPLAVLTMTLLVAYLSLVFGELAPKRLALQRAESFALAAAPPIAALSVALRPVIWLLGRSSDLVVRLFGGDPSRRSEAISDEELRELVTTHEGLGEEERAIVGEVLQAGGRRLVEVMRPRGDIVTLRATMTVAEALEYVRQRPYSRYPVVDRNPDDIEGFVHVRDLAWSRTPDRLVGQLQRPIVLLPGTVPVLSALTTLRGEGKHIAVVVDEHGGTDGIVTMEDLVEELIGEVYDEYDPADRLQRLERSGAAIDTVSADTSLERFAELTGIALRPGPYETVGGYVMAELQRIAVPGDVVALDGGRLVVGDVQRRRVVDVTVERDAVPAPATGD